MFRGFSLYGDAFLRFKIYPAPTDPPNIPADDRASVGVFSVFSFSFAPRPPNRSVAPFASSGRTREHAGDRVPKPPRGRGEGPAVGLLDHRRVPSRGVIGAEQEIHRLAPRTRNIFLAIDHERAILSYSPGRRAIAVDLSEHVCIAVFVREFVVCANLMCVCV